MRLFFDSGATKCDCILLDDNGNYLRHFSGQGINASYTEDAAIDAALSHFADQIGSSSPILSVEFSGAGCGHVANASRVKRLIAKCFLCDDITVESDLMGACKVLCNGKSGMVAILGTGASACLYDGNEIVQQIPSAGYMLGDEGSGTHLGMLFIQHFLRGMMDEKLAEAAGLERSEVIRKVYREAAPNLYFSSWPKFLKEHQENPDIAALIERNFRDFFEMQIMKITDCQSYELHLIGSVAYHFRDDIRKVAAACDVRIAQVRQSPLEVFRRPVNKC